MGLRKQVLAALSALILVGASVGAAASPSDDAFKLFEERCVTLVEKQDNQAFNGLKALPKPDVERIMRSLGSTGDLGRFSIWAIPAEGFLLITAQGRDDFCQMVGIRVPFEAFKPAFERWFKSLGKGFRADSAFEMASREVGQKTRRVASIFLAKPLEGGAFVQVHINLRPDVSDGYASLIVLRLPEKSPAAGELFPDD